MKSVQDIIENVGKTYESVGESEAYKIPTLLVLATRESRNKADVLSDMRAIEGVTIVSVKSQRVIGGDEFNSVSLKIDLSPFGGQSLPEVLLKIKRSIRKIPGITDFKFVGRPESISTNV